MFASTQEAYEAIRSYFGRYGAQLAKNGDASIGLCRYRTDDGNKKCAVGCLIPEALYDEKLEGSKINVDWLKNNPVIAGLFANVDLQFLRAAQVLHDGVAKDAKAFVRGLDVIAALKGLNVPSYGISDDKLLTGKATHVTVQVVEEPEVEHAF